MQNPIFNNHLKDNHISQNPNAISFLLSDNKQRENHQILSRLIRISNDEI